MNPFFLKEYKTALSCPVSLLGILYPYTVCQGIAHNLLNLKFSFESLFSVQSGIFAGTGYPYQCLSVPPFEPEHKI
jgi:hypothetical protein